MKGLWTVKGAAGGWACLASVLERWPWLECEHCVKIRGEKIEKLYSRLPFAIIENCAGGGCTGKEKSYVGPFKMGND